MRIAIIGTGISGMTAAYYLSGDHDLVVYEADAHVGGHTYTVRAKQEDRTFLVDVGFFCL